MSRYWLCNRITLWVMKLRKFRASSHCADWNFKARWTSPPNEALTLNLCKPVLGLIPPDILISPKGFTLQSPQLETTVVYLSISPMFLKPTDSLVAFTSPISHPPLFLYSQYHQPNSDSYCFHQPLVSPCFGPFSAQLGYQVIFCKSDFYHILWLKTFNSFLVSYETTCKNFPWICKTFQNTCPILPPNFIFSNHGVFLNHTRLLIIPNTYSIFPYLDLSFCCSLQLQ